MKKVKCSLSAKSFRDLAESIREYKDSLETKCTQFVNDVAQAGYEVVNAILQEHVDTGLTIGSLEIIEEAESGRYKARVVVSSDAILFLEFGSGLVGQDTAPHAGEFGMGSGTYPGKGHWADTDISVRYGNRTVHYDQGWVYYDEAGHKKVSEGMVASMPMFYGGKAMDEQWREIAKRVFEW